MYMILRVHILSKKVTYIKLKVIGCSPHPIHEYFKVTTLLLTLVYGLYEQERYEIVLLE